MRQRCTYAPNLLTGDRGEASREKRQCIGAGNTGGANHVGDPATQSRSLLID